MAQARRRNPPPAVGRAPTAPNDRRRLHGSIAHDIAVAIVGGRWRPGDVLPNEDAFSLSLSVSRTAYREAVRILAAKGLVESRPKTGTRVCDRSRWNLIDPDVLEWHLEVEPSESFIGALFELRRIVEPPAAALAALRRSDEDLEAMRRALQVMEDDRLSSEVGLRADLEFHHAVLVAAGNEPLASLSSGIGATIRWSTMIKQRAGTLPDDLMADHWRVYETIASSDARAAEAAMTVLVDLALDTTRRALGRATAEAAARPNEERGGTAR